jgi:lipoyl(octanoyl) transferase
MKKAFDTRDLGRMSYEEALSIQEFYFNGMLEQKRKAEQVQNSVFLLVEHNPVYTLGKSGDPENLVNDPKSVGAEFFRTSRGGDITYHGPGQIVGYPIFDLEQFGIGVGKYIWSIEEAIIDVIKPYGLEGERLSDASGVWLDVGKPSVRKICAIGVKASRYVTMHGFAFNVNTDLGFFNHIIPCGIQDKGVTSMENELGRPMDMENIKASVVEAFTDHFRLEEAVK